MPEYTYPYVKTVVVDDADLITAAHHNSQDNQVEGLTNAVRRLDINIARAILNTAIAPGSPVDILTSVALSSTATLRVTTGLSGKQVFTSTNVAGPGGSGEAGFVHRFVCPTALLIGLSSGTHHVAILLWEDDDVVGRIDGEITVP